VRPLAAAAALAGLCLLVVAGLTGAGATGAAAGSRALDRDCADFPDQASAQRYFDQNGGSPSNDFDLLDGDGDGVACESNPCPCAAPGGGNGGPSKKGIRVISVTDGDTIDVAMHGRQEPVRIIGIDTPETYPERECAGAQASASMKKLLQPGDRVRLIRDRSQDNRDVYGRLLRYVEQGGQDVGRQQVHRGWAAVYVFETPFERLGSYRRQSAAAERAGRGAWRLCNGNFHRPL